jgi:DNA-binding NarL/FixJ family response regulator
VIGLAGSSDEALEKIALYRPQVVLLDIALQTESGMHLIKQIRIQFPEAAVLVLSHEEEGLFAESALRAGAKGYVMKQAPADEIIPAIRRVAQGGRYLSADMEASLFERLSKGTNRSSTKLSDRELEVFKMIGAGASTREIANRLNLSVKTIETYRGHIKQKLGLQNGAQLVQRAVHNFVGYCS